MLARASYPLDLGDLPRLRLLNDTSGILVLAQRQPAATSLRRGKRQAPRKLAPRSIRVLSLCVALAN
jgi:hypothetical protein